MYKNHVNTPTSIAVKEWGVCELPCHTRVTLMQTHSSLIMIDALCSGSVQKPMLCSVEAWTDIKVET